MADKKISELVSLTGANAATGDLLPIVDVSATETKKITRQELFSSVPSLTTTGNVTIGGDLTVNGTTTTINTQTLDVEDKNITVAFGSPDAAAANGAGLTVDGANATLTYVSAGDNWALNKPLDVTGNISLTGTVDGRDIAADGSIIDGLGTISTQDANTVNIDGGTIDGTVIGGSTPAAISGTTITGTSFATTGNMTFGDNDKAIFGAGSDLQIYHDGTQSFIEDAGTGDLRLATNGSGVFINKGTSENMAKFLTDGAVELYYDQGTYSTYKLATTATGVDVTGTVTADGLTVGGGGVLSIGTNNAATASDISLSGNAVIGATTSLNAVTGSGGFSVRVNATDPSAGYSDGIPAILIGGGSTNDISFYEDTGTTPKMVWKSADERLGIGTSSPARTLHVSGASTLAQFESSTTGLYLELKNSGGNAAYIGSASGSNLVVETGGTERMRITSTGNVGIGTSSPSKTLHLKSTAPILYFEETDIPQAFSIGSGGGKFFVYDETDARQVLTVDGSGNVGIGNTTPTDKLNISSGSNQIGLDTGNQATYGTLDLGHFTNGAFIGTQAGTNAASNLLRFGTSGTERMRIDASGNLLVGTTDTNHVSKSTEAGFNYNAGSWMAVSRDSGIPAYFNRNTSDGNIIELRKNGATVGSIGTAGGDLTISGPFNHAGIRTFSSSIVPMYNGSIADDTTSLGDGSTRFKDLYLSGGVYLGGTGAANYLDDYEEGTWTVNMYDADTGGNASSAQVTGRYIKIGKQVIASFDALNNIDTSGMTAGNPVYLTLPFAASSTGRSVGCVQLDNITFPSSGTMATTTVADTATRASLNVSGSGTGDNSIKVSDFTSGASDIVNWTLSYRTDA